MNKLFFEKAVHFLNVITFCLLVFSISLVLNIEHTLQEKLHMLDKLLSNQINLEKLNLSKFQKLPKNFDAQQVRALVETELDRIDKSNHSLRQSLEAINKNKK